MGMDIVIVSEISRLGRQTLPVLSQMWTLSPKFYVCWGIFTCALCMLGAYLCVFVGHKSARDYEGRKRS